MVTCIYCTENVADDNTSSGEEELEVRLRWLVFLSTAEHLTYQPQHISLTHIQLSLCVQISDSNKFIGTCTYYIKSSQFLANSPTIWPILSLISTKWWNAHDFELKIKQLTIFLLLFFNKIARFKKCEFLVEVKLAKANTVHLKGHPWYYKYVIPFWMVQNLWNLPEMSCEPTLHHSPPF